MDIIRAIEQQQIKQDLPDFNVGDNVKVHYRITEGNRERIQVFQGDVIRRHGASSRETFTVRKISFSIGVERTFPVHSPKIDKIEVVRHGDVRRAKLYYLRDKVGKAAKINDKSCTARNGASAPNKNAKASSEAFFRGGHAGLVSWEGRRGAGTDTGSRMGEGPGMKGTEPTVEEIRRKLQEAGAREFAVLERSLVADTRKGVRAAVETARRRIEAEQAGARARLEGLYAYERSLAEERGGHVVVGLDEVGRGPLAGPLAVGAVVLPDTPRIEGLNDSKQVKPEARERMAVQVKSCAVAWTVQYVEADVIDAVGVKNGVARHRVQARLGRHRGGRRASRRGASGRQPAAYGRPRGQRRQGGLSLRVDRRRLHRRESGSRRPHVPPG